MVHPSSVAQFVQHHMTHEFVIDEEQPDIEVDGCLT
jgi:hypothetical protein